MKQKPIVVRKQTEYEPWDIHVGTCEGFGVYNHVSVQEQKEAVEAGMSLNDFYEFCSQSHRDWQADC